MISSKKLVFVAALALLLSACTMGELSPDQLAATANQMAATGIAATLAALPTNTDIPTATDEPSATPEPSLTPSEAATETATDTEVPYVPGPTWTPFGQLSGNAKDTAQADKADKNAPLQLSNQSGEDVLFTILSPVYQEYSVKGSAIIIIPEGTYTFRAEIGKNKVNGSFSITNGDKHVLTFYKDKVHFATP